MLSFELRWAQYDKRYAYCKKPEGSHVEMLDTKHTLSCR